MNQQYSWFYLPTDLLKNFSEEELSIVKVEPTNDEISRLWYPVSKWTERPMTKEGVQKALQSAIDDNDLEDIKFYLDKLKGFK